jgi:large subunit ribosomal protein L17
MRHGVDHRKLGRKPSHRKALLRNLMNALVHAERIETTVAKAKELRPLADRLITLGKAATLHSRRRVFSLLTDKEATDKLFATLAGRFEGRQGGYTRIVRTGFRVGDGAEMAIIEYLPAEEKKAGRKGKKKTAAKKAPAKGAGKKKETQETPRPDAKKVKPVAPKPTKPRASRAQTQKTPEGGQG